MLKVRVVIEAVNAPERQVLNADLRMVEVEGNVMQGDGQGDESVKGGSGRW